MTWLSGALALACLGVAGLHLLRLMVLRGGAAELSHAAMAAGTAAMLSPLGDPLPPALWAATFVVCGALFVPRTVRGGDAGADARHQVVGSAAMLVMLFGHGSAASAAGVLSVVALVLAGHLSCHALRCVDRLVDEPRPVDASRLGGGFRFTATGFAVAARPPGAVLLAPATATVAHVSVAAVMAVMLLAML